MRVLFTYVFQSKAESAYLGHGHYFRDMESLTKQSIDSVAKELSDQNEWKAGPIWISIIKMDEPPTQIVLDNPSNP